jgi:quercetin dioxygenase-like cupin family protein
MEGLYRPANEASSKQVQMDWGRITWLANQELTNCPDITLGRVVITVGMANPDHYHPNSSEILHVLEGTIRRTVGDDAIIMNAGDTCVVPPDIRHGAANIGDRDADLIVAFTSGALITKS